MKLKIVETKKFSKTVGNLIKKGHLLEKDYDLFKRGLAEAPEMGALIAGTGGIRKIRLKAPSKGKRGSFRVCYYYLVDEEIYLLLIYAKNEKENLTMQEKKELKYFVKILKGHNG